MSLPRTLTRDDRFSLTELGRRILEEADTCLCRPHLAGVIVVCEDCGTVMGVLKEPLAYGRAAPKADR
jgi:hypothetical protein